ncbi:hypothetical protein [Micromonospora sp. NPDC051141]|uniref:hypothetical protein n=1 Tax=Micromonospora sp. NPDC051141 TaxID=3364284 RepID=UPI003796E034
MMVTATPTWRPFHDEPLFTDDLLHGIDDIPEAVRAAVITYLEQVAYARRAPLHTATAFNALHFGFDPQTRGYQAAVLDPELFVRLDTGTAPLPVLPVGTFVRIERGQQSLWAEVVARFGAHDETHSDGWVPAHLSGAPATLDAMGSRPERVILDPEAFGAPLTPRERIELRRLRQRGVLLDDRGHLTGKVCYPNPQVADLDDTTLYAHHLLTAGKPLLVGGPLGGLLIDPHDDDTLAMALQTALDTIDKLLDQTPHLRRWGAYATPAERYERRRDHPGLLGGADLDDVAHVATRATLEPRFTGVWPLLAGWVDSAKVTDPEQVDVDPLELTAAGEAVAHVNLAIADVATSAIDGLLVNGVHLRIDDQWQAAGVWLAQPEPVQIDVRGVDPLRPLALGYHESLPSSSFASDTPPDRDLSDRQLDDGTADQPDGADTDTAADGKGRDTGEDTPTGGDQVRKESGPDDADPDAADIDLPDGSADDAVEDAIVVEHLHDSLIVYTVALRPAHLDGDTLPLPDHVDDLLADGTLVIELHHDSDNLDDDERIQQVERSDGELSGFAWPLSFYPGIKVTVAVARGARRLSAATTLLTKPLLHGAAFRWAADVKILVAALGIDLPDDGPQTPEQTVPRAANPNVPARHQGIDPLRTLIVTTLRRHGAAGSFGARRLTGPQLFTALFGPDLSNPALMWQVIYTCDRLVDAGKLTCEPNQGRPDKPGSGGPDTFVWWPNDAARRQAQSYRDQQRRMALRGKVHEHWVPPGTRALPGGYQASDEARSAYAEFVRKVRGPKADTRLPNGYTFVRGHTRGSEPGSSWLSLI